MKRNIFIAAGAILLVFAFTWFSYFRGGQASSYNIVSGNSASSLVQNVQKAMSEGWEPQGGISMDGGTYNQAMVR